MPEVTSVAKTRTSGLPANHQLDDSGNLYVNVAAGGAGGGAVTVADGADVTQGALADAGVVTDASGSLSAKLRGLIIILLRAFQLGTPLRVDPVGTTTQPVSAASLPLPSGASTAAKQPALGTAGTASADVLTIQGIASMTAVKTDSSATTQPVSGTVTANQGGAPWTVSQVPATSGGLSISRTLSVANTTGTNPKGSAGQVYGFVITNTNAAARFVKLYNKATAPSVGSDTPVMTLAIPGNATGAGMVAAEFTSGIAFGTGIGMGITTGVADADTGAPAANEVVVNLFYK
jgi:hypothetical protein